jgi:hypothetical protein
MTAAEKAKELVQKYLDLKAIKLSDYSVIYLPTAKECALIAAEEVMEYSVLHGFVGLSEYYAEVIEEIKNL